MWPAIGLVVLAMAAGACTAHVKVARSVAVQSPRAEPTTPEATVVAYYAAVGRHDWSSAAALLDPTWRAGMANAFVGDRDNIVRLDHLRDLRVTPATHFEGLPRGYHNIKQVFVTYDVVYKQVVASGNGANSRFLYLGQDVKTGHWRILTIGTGP